MPYADANQKDGYNVGKCEAMETLFHISKLAGSEPPPLSLVRLRVQILDVFHLITNRNPPKTMNIDRIYALPWAGICGGRKFDKLRNFSGNNCKTNRAKNHDDKLLNSCKLPDSRVLIVVF